jgi:hypothetical protein
MLVYVETVGSRIAEGKAADGPQAGLIKVTVVTTPFDIRTSVWVAGAGALAGLNNELELESGVATKDTGITTVTGAPVIMYVCVLVTG